MLPSGLKQQAASHGRLTANENDYSSLDDPGEGQQVGVRPQLGARTSDHVMDVFGRGHRQPHVDIRESQ